MQLTRAVLSPIIGYRLISGLDCGVTTEQNGVAFGHYFERSSEDPYAVLTIDSVDQDDLHPYHPHEHVRKVINGTVVLLVVPRGRQENSRGRNAGLSMKKVTGTTILT